MRRHVFVPADEIETGPPRPKRRRATLIAAVTMLGLLALLAFFGRERLAATFAPRTPDDGPDASTDTQHAADNGDSAAPLTGFVKVMFWRPGDSARRNISVSDPAALPIHPGDQIRIQAQVNRPACLYLIWIDAQGHAEPVYPWSPGDWTRIAGPVEPKQSLSLPETPDRGWPMQGGPGMETLLLLARETPLPPSVPLEELFAGLPAQTMQNDQSLVYLDRGLILVDKATDRAPQFFREQQIDDPVLTTQRLLTERLAPYFDVIQAVSFANRGE